MPACWIRQPHTASACSGNLWRWKGHRKDRVTLVQAATATLEPQQRPGPIPHLEGKIKFVGKKLSTAAQGSQKVVKAFFGIEPYKA